jgi:hypothetical protein
LNPLQNYQGQAQITKKRTPTIIATVLEKESSRPYKPSNINGYK